MLGHWTCVRVFVRSLTYKAGVADQNPTRSAMEFRQLWVLFGVRIIILTPLLFGVLRNIPALYIIIIFDN